MKQLAAAAGLLGIARRRGRGADPPPAPVAAHQGLVNQYCAGCHNDRRKAGGFSWTAIDLADPGANAAQSEKVIRRLRSGLMPPPGAPRPEPASLVALAGAIEAAIDRTAAARPFAGAPELRRLNRTEYRNSIRDLLDLDVDVSAMLPQDQLGRGFDNMAEALTVTPSLVQGYVRAASKISREALGDRDVTPAMTMYRVPKVVNQMRHVEGAPWGTRGGTAVVHNFPADGEYTFRLALYYDYLETLFGQSLPRTLQGQQIEVAVDGARVALFTIDPSIPETKALLTTPKIAVTAGPAPRRGRVHRQVRRPDRRSVPAGGAVDDRHQRRRARAGGAAAPVVDDRGRAARRHRRVRHAEPAQDPRRAPRRRRVPRCRARSASSARSPVRRSAAR